MDREQICVLPSFFLLARTSSCLTWMPSLSGMLMLLFWLAVFFTVLQKFYMVGRDKSRTYCRVLTIDRSEPCELNIHEDPATYTESECNEILKRINEGNKSTGGLKFVTICYGIVGMLFNYYPIT